MQKIDYYFDFIDHSRITRAKRLNELTELYETQNLRHLIDVASKAIIVLCYAEWEGFFNECVDHYVNALKSMQVKPQDFNRRLMICVMDDQFNSLIDRNHSVASKIEFLDSLEKRKKENITNMNYSLIKAQSNLDFEKLSRNFNILTFDYAALQKHRNKIDKELVGWRHNVAHGESPDLSAVDAKSHIDFSNEMLLTISDIFQENMLPLIEGG